MSRRNAALAWLGFAALAAGSLGGLGLIASAVIAWGLAPGWTITAAEAIRAAAGLAAEVAGALVARALVSRIRPGAPTT